MNTITLGGGCFWCIEAVYQQLRGVSRVVSGYAGGDLFNPTYENHGTHAEVVQITYNENEISLKDIFKIFFAVHNPTTLDKQGHDIGSQYRSIILCNDYLETEIAHNVIRGIKDLWPNPIVTEVQLLEKFYPAEDYHQDFYKNNLSNPYCQVIISPKLTKLQDKFAHLLK